MIYEIMPYILNIRKYFYILILMKNLTLIKIRDRFILSFLLCVYVIIKSVLINNRK